MTAQRGLEIADLTVRFGDVVAVDRVDLSVPNGGVTAVLGPSGCGKSTLLCTVAGLETPSTGTVTFDGEDMSGVPPHRRGFALMFQDGQLFGHRTVADNVAYPLEIRHVRRAERRARTAELLDLVGLPGYQDRMPDSLSGGEQQRVALARALAVSPRLLLLDEPLSALDRDLRERLAADLHRILRAAGTTALLVTHDHEEAFAIADRMAVMREGRIVQHGTIDEVWRRPRDGWTARFLGYATVLTGEAALRIRRLVAPAATWTSVALRRSALQVAADGELAARVLELRASPELVRLEVAVPGIGQIAAVAEPAEGIRVGDDVMLKVEPERLAVLGPVDAQ